jgi:hypothetical protein
LAMKAQKQQTIGKHFVAKKRTEMK